MSLRCPCGGSRLAFPGKVSVVRSRLARTALCGRSAETVSRAAVGQCFKSGPMSRGRLSKHYWVSCRQRGIALISGPLTPITVRVLGLVPGCSDSRITWAVLHPPSLRGGTFAWLDDRRQITHSPRLAGTAPVRRAIGRAMHGWTVGELNGGAYRLILLLVARVVSVWNARKSSQTPRLA